MAGRRYVVAWILLLVVAACRTPLPEGAEGFSLDGRVLRPMAMKDEVRIDRAAKLAKAEERLAENADDKDAWIWVGRRLGYLGRYRDAIRIYSEALQKWPGDPFLLRHRGHRYLSVREIGNAIADLSRAADACRTIGDVTEPDGLPVPGRPPHSSLHFNVHYHLALASFVRGDAATAERQWLDCLACCDDDESRVAVTHWLWCARVRNGDPAGATACVQGITADMDVVENTSYHELCLLYKGERERGQLGGGEGSSGAALRFGLAHYDLVTGKLADATRQLQELAEDPMWAAFGVIAAEAELRRL